MFILCILLKQYKVSFFCVFVFLMQSRTINRRQLWTVLYCLAIVKRGTDMLERGYEVEHTKFLYPKSTAKLRSISVLPHELNILCRAIQRDRPSSSFARVSKFIFPPQCSFSDFALGDKSFATLLTSITPPNSTYFYVSIFLQLCKIDKQNIRSKNFQFL